MEVKVIFLEMNKYVHLISVLLVISFVTLTFALLHHLLSSGKIELPAESEI
jgi:hypothetical protein